MDFNAHRKLAEQIEADLFSQLKGGKRMSKYILCEGLHGYRWMATYCARRATPDRVGRFKPLTDILEGSINEYTAITGESTDTLTFTITDFTAIEKIFVGVPENAWSSYNGNFFDNFKNNS